MYSRRLNILKTLLKERGKKALLQEDEGHLVGKKISFTYNWNWTLKEEEVSESF